MERSLDNNKLFRVAENLKVIEENINNAAIKAGRDPSEILLMAATKTVPPEIINHAISLGVRAIGENRVQEFLEKEPFLNLDGVATHFIGALQTNKVKKLIPNVHMIESVDSIRLANTIARFSRQKNVITDVLIEVNIGNEESKAGICKTEVEEFAAQISEIEGISLRGIMSIPPICDESSQIRNYFSEIHKLFIDIRDKRTDNNNVNVLSMGMSGDYIDAVLEGSNIVRIGSALFGSR